MGENARQDQLEDCKRNLGRHEEKIPRLRRNSATMMALRLAMVSITHAGFRIKSFKDGSLYRARVQKKDDTPVIANGKSAPVWETNQCADPDTAVGQAKFAIDTNKLK